MTPQEVLEYSEALKINPHQIFLKLASAQDTTEAQTFLDEIKKNAHKRFRILAKELHPDHTQDPDKIQKFKNIKEVLDEFDKSVLEDFISIPTNPSNLHISNIPNIQIIIIPLDQPFPDRNIWPDTSTSSGTNDIFTIKR